MTTNLLPAFQTTPKRGKPTRRTLKLPNILREFADENNGRVELTEPNIVALEQRGLPAKRFPQAIHALRKFYGMNITTERTGRKASAYIIQ